MAKPRASRLCKPFMLPFLILFYVDGRKLLIGHCFGIHAACGAGIVFLFVKLPSGDDCAEQVQRFGDSRCALIGFPSVHSSAA